MLENVVKESFTRNGIPLEHWEAAPAVVFYAEESFLQKYCAICTLPEKLTALLIEFGKKVQADPFLRNFSWQLYRQYVSPGPLRPYPNNLDFLGNESGLLYQLITVAIIPAMEFRMTEWGPGGEYAHQACQRIGSMWVYRNMQLGLPGINGGNGLAVRNFLQGNFYRIGRLEFAVQPYDFRYQPIIFRKKDGTPFALAPSSFTVSSSTGFLEGTEVPFFHPCLEWTDTSVTGHAIDLETGRISPVPETYSLREMTLLTTENSYCAGLHIPYGGKMTPEACTETFREARAFFQKYFPERVPRVYFLDSWVCNPDLLEYIPNSNLAKFRKRGYYCYVITTQPKEGLSFLFGKNDGDLRQYPRDTSMRRAMLDCYFDHGCCLKRACMFLLPEMQ